MSESPEELLQRARREMTLKSAVLDPSTTWRPFPLEFLPPVLRRFVTQAARAQQCDPAMIAVTCLTACGAAIGNSRVALLKKGFTQPAVLWVGVVADPSSGKGPAQRVSARPVLKRQSLYAKQHQEAMTAYESDRAARNALSKAERAALSEPQMPLMNHCLISDATAEAIGVRLWASPRGLLCLVEELASVLKSFNQYKKTGSDKESWIGFYDAAYVKIDRKTGLIQTQIIPRAFVALAGGIQPEVLASLLRDEDFDSGFAYRFLFVAPPRTPKHWDEIEIDDEVEQAYTDVADRLFDLPMDHDADGTPEPKCLPLTTAARTAWGTFFNDVEALLNEDDGRSAVFDALPKLRAVAARIALILQLVSHASGEDHAADNCIDQRSMERGIALARWFIHEQNRVYALLGVSKGQRRLARIVQIVRDAGGLMSVRDYQRKRSLRTSTAAESELQLLVDAKVGRWDHKPQTGPGKPSKRLVLNDNTPAGDSATPNMVCQNTKSNKEAFFPSSTHTELPADTPSDSHSLNCSDMTISRAALAQAGILSLGVANA